MQLPYRQRGAGWFGKLYTFGTLGFIVFLGLKMFPIYMNELKIRKAVTAVAGETTPADAEAGSWRRSLQGRFDIESVDIVTLKDIKIRNTEKGKVMSYDYWNQIELVTNVYLSFHFVLEEKLKGVSS